MFVLPKHIAKIQIFFNSRTKKRKRFQIIWAFQILSLSLHRHVRRLRRHARTVNKTADKEEVPDIVLSLLGAGTPVADDDLNARKAYNEYLEEKYK